MGENKGGKKKKADAQAGDSIIIGANGFGLTLPIGRIARLLFPKTVARSEAIAALTRSAAEKIAAGHSLSAEEEFMLGLVLAPLVRKAKRLAAVVDRADAINSTEPQQLPVTAQSSAEPAAPSEAWSERFIAGAELASDAGVTEMWARILAGEVTRPGSFSFKTLSVLRDISTETADSFVRLICYRVETPGGALGFVPNFGVFEKRYEKANLGYMSLLDLADAGLVSFRDSATRGADGKPTFFIVHGLVARLTTVWGGSGVQVHPLTRAGDELASIADVKVSPDHLEDIRAWLGSAGPQLEVAIPPDSDVTLDALEFRAWTPGSVVFEAGVPRFASPPPEPA
jgi:hypothetical protein